MAIVRKFTVGVMPATKMYRVRSLGGQVVDALIALRIKELEPDYFEQVMAAQDNSGYKVTGRNGQNAVHVTDSTVTFVRDFYESNDQFNFDRVYSELKIIWPAINSVLQINDVRRVGMVTECEYVVNDGKFPSVWLRDKLTPTLSTDHHADKFILKFEERSVQPDGKLPDPNTSDFHNAIYQIYDSDQDSERPKPGFVRTVVDSQKYFAPVKAGRTVAEEVLKLRKVHEDNTKRMDGLLKKLGATHGKA